jgi:tight adherence protein B
MPVIILSILIFLIIGSIVSVLILSSQREKRSRLMKVVRGNNYQDNKKVSKDIKEQRNADLSKKLNSVEDDTNKKKEKITIKEKIMQAGMEISVQKFWIGSVISCIVLTLLVKFMGASPFVTLMAAIIGLLGLPRFFLNIKIGKRQKKFMEDFPDALESMMRLLKAGMPISEAIKMVAREFEGPMGEEMERIFDQQKIGIPLPEAVLEASKRMPLTEMQMFATAIAIQTQTGSSLSEVLQNLASVIRSRFKLARKVKALSSEAKASAMIIGALPLVVAGGMWFVNRPYIELLFIDPTGKFLLGCAVGWMCVGVFVMKQMINFKV